MRAKRFFIIGQLHILGQRFGPCFFFGGGGVGGQCLVVVLLCCIVLCSLTIMSLGK